MSMEKILEHKCVQWVESLLDDTAIDSYKMPVHGRAIKGPAMQYKGIPDRILILPNGGGTVWVEFKSEDSYYKLTPTQVVWKDTIRASSPDRYFVISNYEDLEALKKVCLGFMNKSIV